MTETLQTRRWPDWFTNGYAQEAFERHLIPLAGREGLRFLQIGAYAGDASLWMTKHILTGRDCMLVDVDTWRGSNEIDHGGIDFDEVFDFYLRRVGGKVSWLRATSDSFFRQRWQTARYDFVYIDGSHETAQVLRDAIHGEAVLKPGGLIAFDDYLWGANYRNVPRPAIDAFMRCYEDTLEVLEVGLQVWCRKKGSR
jgi:predicted O-methyltransferase YrrM